MVSNPLARDPHGWDLGLGSDSAVMIAPKLSQQVCETRTRDSGLHSHSFASNRLSGLDPIGCDLSPIEGVHLPHL